MSQQKSAFISTIEQSTHRENLPEVNLVIVAREYSFKEILPSSHLEALLGEYRKANPASTFKIVTIKRPWGNPAKLKQLRIAQYRMEALQKRAVVECPMFPDQLIKDELEAKADFYTANRIEDLRQIKTTKKERKTYEMVNFRLISDDIVRQVNEFALRGFRVPTTDEWNIISWAADLPENRFDDFKSRIRRKCTTLDRGMSQYIKDVAESFGSYSLMGIRLGALSLC